MSSVYYILVVIFCVVFVKCQYEWQARDAFDEIKAKMDNVHGDNCPIQNLYDLFLPQDTVSHVPDIKEININPIFPNRTALLLVHNIALSRAYFFSYILQARFIRPAINDTYDPGMMYYFLSTVADVASNPYVNASAIYFAPNSSYTPSYRGFFNKTMPRFAPRTFRADDFNDAIHVERMSTLNTFTVQDLGAFSNESLSMDYTTDYYRINKWYKTWLPDNVNKRHDTKTTYQVQIRYANNTNETFTFHGPPGPDETPSGVKFSNPYFDCGRSNKWIVPVVSPIVDIYPRHTGFRHIEYPTYTAISVLEMDFDRIDINQCPRGEGNDGPNHFADTARCKKETTECEPIHGWGFRRGGYQCRCRPGWRLPPLVRRPYLGEILERVTSEQYYNGFDCLKIGWIHKMPIKWEREDPYIREKYLDKYYEYRSINRSDHQHDNRNDGFSRNDDNYRYNSQSRTYDNRKYQENENFRSGSDYSYNYENKVPGPEVLHSVKKNVHHILTYLNSVNKHTCKKMRKEDLTLHGDIAFGAEEFFSNQARMAVRLSHFISSFLQVSDPKEVFSGKRVTDKPLSEDQMMGETLALVLGDTKIWSAGTYWQRNKFTNRTLFAPYAYRKALNDMKAKMEDLARLNTTEEVYTNNEWFQFLQQRWSSNFDALEKYFIKLKIRFNETGEYLRKYEVYPISYRAANLDDGYWTTPYFDCDGKINRWVMTYASPFFGWDSLKVKIEFKGVVAVTVDLMQLDINQCPDKYFVPNAFKGTHKCHQNSYCVPILGRGFDAGGYKCQCLQGYEYPFEDLITYFDGQLVEAEFLNLVQDNATRYDMFKCRLAGASSIQASSLIILAIILFRLFNIDFN